MLMILRYVDKEAHIHEAFIGFVECEQGTLRQAICDAIKVTLRKLGLDLNNCRGQRYDGMGNMSMPFAACSSYEFIVSLVIIGKGLSVVQSATAKLQYDDTDLVKAYRKIKLLVKTFEKSLIPITRNDLRRQTKSQRKSENFPINLEHVTNKPTEVIPLLNLQKCIILQQYQLPSLTI